MVRRQTHFTQVVPTLTRPPPLHDHSSFGTPSVLGQKRLNTWKTLKYPVLGQNTPFWTKSPFSLGVTRGFFTLAGVKLDQKGQKSRFWGVQIWDQGQKADLPEYLVIFYLIMSTPKMTREGGSRRLGEIFGFSGLQWFVRDIFLARKVVALAPPLSRKGPFWPPKIGFFDLFSGFSSKFGFFGPNMRLNRGFALFTVLGGPKKGSFLTFFSGFFRFFTILGVSQKGSNLGSKKGHFGGAKKRLKSTLPLTFQKIRDYRPKEAPPILHSLIDSFWPLICCLRAICVRSVAYRSYFVKQSVIGFPHCAIFP